MADRHIAHCLSLQMGVGIIVLLSARVCVSVCVSHHRDAAKMQSFIRDKYTNKRWADPHKTWPPTTDTQHTTTHTPPSAATATSSEGTPTPATGYSPCVTGGGSNVTDAHLARRASMPHLTPVMAAARAGPHTSAALTAPFVPPPPATHTSGPGTPTPTPTARDVSGSPLAPNTPQGAGSSSGPELAQLIPTDEDTEDTLSQQGHVGAQGHVASVGHVGGVGQQAQVVVDPTLGVLEWLDMQSQE